MNDETKMALLEQRIMQLEQQLKELTTRTDVNEEEIDNVKREIATIREMMVEMKVLSKLNGDKIDVTNSKIDRVLDKQDERFNKLTETLIDIVKSNHADDKQNSKLIRNMLWKIIVSIIAAGGAVWGVAEILIKAFFEK